MDDVGTVHLLHHAPGIRQSCRLCLKVLSTGYYAIAVIIRNQRFVIGMEPPPVCCGEVKESLMQVFATQAEAAEAGDRVIETYARDGSTKNIPLLQMVFTVPPAVAARC